MSDIKMIMFAFFGICIAFRSKLIVLIDRYFDKTSVMTIPIKKETEREKTDPQNGIVSDGKERDPSVEIDLLADIKETALAPADLFKLFNNEDHYNGK